MKQVNRNKRYRKKKNKPRDVGMKPISCLFTYEMSQIAAWTALVVLAEVRHAPCYAQGSKTKCTIKIQLFLFRTGTVFCTGSHADPGPAISENADPDIRKAI